MDAGVGRAGAGNSSLTPLLHLPSGARTDTFSNGESQRRHRCAQYSLIQLIKNTRNCFAKLSSPTDIYHCVSRLAE
ncbi:uncharacterized protein LOC135113721 isoform X3 [Scylla paramamosain]|uniref:uncharacterized protein LOC135113721 isoform X3 n=1 Tax=Scylla paramamosain TaxID=85552 RepID=UPI0030833EB8